MSLQQAEQINDSDDDVPRLSANTLAALQDFYQEQSQAQDQNCVGEDWQLSQFWYDNQTAETLAKEAIKASNNGSIACLSCPTLYRKLVELNPDNVQYIIFEYDKRFEIYGDDFIFYDYNEPMKFPSSVGKNSFDVVVADPPFLTEECLTKTACSIRYLTKDKIILCTGLKMQTLAERLLNLNVCQFRPKHANKLGNEFGSFTNYETTFLN
ncbi:Protein-lysine N-methyltransferase n6amt2 [Trichoplax sp. H2]|uniref:Protein-lysine N-methyltransferase TRIADDRAFT_25578 n=1 Tax=Trichoplax adhaerens TaxID=10228 RepID=B3RXQ3_TRIAD|nr:hypothetical protein TRIADDRAFT_25578 [Trichoplax adhaerens]EDV24898.1 hypothetical protein TRIADDRAFT_25578 [Trichoplax adhaerens]RDD46735.1 Protein-lysine N-methyltransferase n6amt2 [Trichoplax sp. H2]|eukprot:XP_002112788.1 hypothetical protein TRIADDRAFT_25578 [Trichoplax adhaerens]